MGIQTNGLTETPMTRKHVTTSRQTSQFHSTWWEETWIPKACQVTTLMSHIWASYFTSFWERAPGRWSHSVNRQPLCSHHGSKHCTFNQDSYKEVAIRTWTCMGSHRRAKLTMGSNSRHMTFWNVLQVQPTHWLVCNHIASICP